MSAAGNPSSAPTPPNNTLTLSADGGDLTGWQAIRVSRRLEAFCNDFELSFTDRSTTGAPVPFEVKPFDPCVIKIGGEAVVTGYVDDVAIAITPTSHSVHVRGRGKCEDLIDCSITQDQLHGMTITTSSLLDLATKLAKPYSINVVDLTGTGAPVSLAGGVPLTFNAILTETSYEIIERVARYAGVLVYEDQLGQLTIANVGKFSHSSGFAQGVNVQAAHAVLSGAERYSVYLPAFYSTNQFGDSGSGLQSFVPVKDAGVPRLRQLTVVSQQFMPTGFLAQKTAEWEAARRKGRSQAVRITCDSWRDSAGLLWQPNYGVPVDIGALHVSSSQTPWVVGEVHYMVDADRGTVADLMLMPKDAFQPQPIILRPDPWDPTNNRPSGGAAAAP